MKKLLIGAAVLIATISTLSAQQNYQELHFTSSGGTQLNCRTLEPNSIKKGKKYPLVIFMHGAGERGDDNEKQLVHGSGIFLNPYNQDNYPAFVVFPQCPENSSWAMSSRSKDYDPENNEPTALTVAVRELIGKYLQDERVDSKRVYIMGLSMGGIATYDMVIRYPELFAAAVPICGIVDGSRLNREYDTEFWIFHGDQDRTVPVEGSRGAYRALVANGNTPRYTEFAGCDHASWNMAFNMPDFMQWLFSQHL